MARKPKVKKQTLNEFQSWLQGIIEIQPEGWTPDAAQWKMIYERIINIKEPEPEKVVEQQPQQIMPYIPQQPVHMPPGGMPPPPGPVPPVMPEVEMTEAAKRALAGGTPENPAPTATPVVSEDGNIQSSFE